MVNQTWSHIKGLPGITCLLHQSSIHVSEMNYPKGKGTKSSSIRYPTDMTLKFNIVRHIQCHD